MKFNKNIIISLFSVGLFLLISHQVQALTPNAVDRIAFRIGSTPIINEEKNTINLDWLRDLKFNALTQRYGTGADMDLKTEQGIVDARHAIWKSDTVQNAYQAYENTLSGDKQAAKDRFIGSIERGLQEISSDTTVTGRLSKPLPPIPATIRPIPAIARPLPPIPGPKVVVPGLDLPQTEMSGEGSLTDRDTLPESMKTVRETSTKASVTADTAQDIIKNDSYPTKLTPDGKASREWIQSLVQKLQRSGAIIDLNDMKALSSLSGLIFNLNESKFKNEFSAQGKRYNLAAKNIIRQSISNHLAQMK